MSTQDNIVDGMLTYAREEIKRKITAESEKIVSEVITEIMHRLNCKSVQRPECRRTEVIFMFEQGGKE